MLACPVTGVKLDARRQISEENLTIFVVLQSSPFFPNDDIFEKTKAQHIVFFLYNDLIKPYCEFYSFHSKIIVHLEFKICRTKNNYFDPTTIKNKSFWNLLKKKIR